MPKGLRGVHVLLYAMPGTPVELGPFYFCSQGCRSKFENHYADKPIGGNEHLESRKDVEYFGSPGPGDPSVEYLPVDKLGYCDECRGDIE